MNKTKENEVKRPTIEELTKFIKEDPIMQKLPKKRLTVKTRRNIALISILVLLALYVIFIIRPHVFKIDFMPEQYNLYGYTIKTLKNKKIQINDNIIEVGERIVKILPYTNYIDKDNNYILLLSMYGHLYSYCIDTGELFRYLETDEYVVSDIIQNKLDLYDTVEVIINKTNERKIVGANLLINSNSENLSIMDELVYNKNDDVIFLKDKKSYLCKYNKINSLYM